MRFSVKHCDIMRLSRQKVALCIVLRPSFRPVRAEWVRRLKTLHTTQFASFSFIVINIIQFWTTNFSKPVLSPHIVFTTTNFFYKITYLRERRFLRVDRTPKRSDVKLPNFGIVFSLSAGICVLHCSSNPHILAFDSLLFGIFQLPS